MNRICINYQRNNGSIQLQTATIWAVLMRPFFFIPLWTTSYHVLWKACNAVIPYTTISALQSRIWSTTNESVASVTTSLGSSSTPKYTATTRATVTLVALHFRQLMFAMVSSKAGEWMHFCFVPATMPQQQLSIRTVIHSSIVSQSPSELPLKTWSPTLYMCHLLFIKTSPVDSFVLKTKQAALYVKPNSQIHGLLPMPTVMAPL